MIILSLDIGKRHTGAAFVREEDGIPLALDTIHHKSIEELAQQVSVIINEKHIDHLVLGLPLLPSGEEGSQVAFVRAVSQKLEENDISMTFIDERYTTPKKCENDENTAAACALLAIYLRRKSI
ncbi:Holliday junction resolvase RuvX [Patescibacteria group bacterium]|nr:Holliday junction resolvase RuvX [Patescibacteria group bacterium]